jgi:hypothetical protein
MPGVNIEETRGLRTTFNCQFAHLESVIFSILDMSAMTATLAILRHRTHSRGFSSLERSSMRRCCQESVSFSCRPRSRAKKTYCPRLSFFTPSFLQQWCALALRRHDHGSTLRVRNMVVVQRCRSTTEILMGAFHQQQ